MSRKLKKGLEVAAVVLTILAAVFVFWLVEGDTRMDERMMEWAGTLESETIYLRRDAERKEP